MTPTTLSPLTEIEVRTSDFVITNTYNKVVSFIG